MNAVEGYILWCGYMILSSFVLQYQEELDLASVPATKHVYMALINAYAACGEFDKAKKVMPVEQVNLLGSCLLAMNNLLVHSKKRIFFSSLFFIMRYY